MYTSSTRTLSATPHRQPEVMDARTIARRTPRLHFLRSGENDIGAFADSKCRRARSKFISGKTRSQVEHCSPCQKNRRLNRRALLAETGADAADDRAVLKVCGHRDCTYKTAEKKRLGLGV